MYSFQTVDNEQIAYQVLLKLIESSNFVAGGLKLRVFRVFTPQLNSFLDIAKQGIYHLKFRLLLPSLAVCPDYELKQDRQAK
jgi:hypothetical protein